MERLDTMITVVITFMVAFSAFAQNVTDCECIDEIPPNSMYTCEEQKQFGKCDREWMVGYCECTCGRSSCAQAQKKTASGGPCLAVFDFDDTLKLHYPARNAPDAESVIQKSLDFGYNVGIASASCTHEYLKNFLNENILPGFFDEDYFNSNRFRICNSYKRASLEDILGYFGTTFECTMFFDDSDYRGQFKDTALIYTQVTRGVGVTMGEFDAASKLLNQQCNCNSVM